MVKLMMQTGEEMDLSISMGGLRRIRDVYPDFYKRYFDALNGDKTQTSEEAVWRSSDILYVAYLCGEMDNLDKALSYDDFLDILPADVTMIIMASTVLINPNQIGDFEAYLKRQQGKSQKTR